MTAVPPELEGGIEEAAMPSRAARHPLRRLTRHRLAFLGGCLVTVVVLVAILGPWIAPHDPLTLDVRARLQGPSAAHPFGTDHLGRDTLSRVLMGARTSLLVSLAAVGLALVGGTFFGLVAGYRGGWVDEAVMRAMDVLFAFPAILLAIAILAALGPGVQNVMIAIGVVYTPIFARIARAGVLQLREAEFVQAARAAGSPDQRILVRHLLPNLLAPIVVQTSLSLGFAILSEASLSFLGLGVQPPEPSWGRMLSEGREYLQTAPWASVFPGLAIMATVLGFNLLGDGLRDTLDPRLRNVLEA